MGTALLLITHDLGLVAQYTDRVLVLEKGVLVEAGQTREVLAAPKHPYTAKLVGSLPRPGDGGATGGGGDVLLSIEQAVVEYRGKPGLFRSEEHTSELQSLMRISYAVFCLKKTTYIQR